jgi:hypothetical protein
VKRLASVASILALALGHRYATADATHTCVEAANEGQSLRDTGKLSAARDAFVQCSAAACPVLVRESCERWGLEIEPRLPTIVLGARDEAGSDLSEVRVSIDGKPLTGRLDGRSITVDPGPHELVFEAEGFEPVRQFLVAREGERVRGVVAVIQRRTPVAESQTAGGNRTPLVLGGGVALLGLAGFTTFGLWGKREHDRLADTCAPSRTCARGDVRGVEMKFIVADASLLVGIVGVGVLAAYLIPSLFKSDASPKKPRLSLSAGPVQGGFFGAMTYGY